ncbi:PapD-like protein [Lyophyllum atratum]|nr:PapD-like protein [Lyophyllum atratum]
MSVSLNPSNALGFKRPLTTLVKRSLTITNHNSQPVAFKVKTTAPRLYCVRPNSGRVEPGESVDVSVMLQALREEPPSNAKCKDKFLIQSTLITAEKETMPLQDIWSATDGSEEAKVHQQKLKVTYLPAEGQTLEEEEEPQQQPNPSSFIHPNDSQFDTVRQNPSANGHAQPIPQFNEPPPPPSHEPRPNTPPADFSVAREDSREDSAQEVPLVHVTEASEPSPVSPAPPVAPPLASDSDLEYAPEPAPEPVHVPEPMPVAAPVPVPAPGVTEAPNPELLAKYQAALSEVDRLRSILSTMEEEAAPTETELRRRRPAMSDDGSVAETDVGTMIDDSHYHHQQEGVPLQVVVIIALGVFITTYLFF